MKKLLVAICMILSFQSMNAQEVEPKTFNGEIGFDATSLVGRFFNVSDFGFFVDNRQPTYFIYYRQHVGDMRIRATAGGDYLQNDSETNDNAWSYNYKIGAEFINDLSKRFQLIYGLDIAGGDMKSYREFEYASQYLMAYNDELSYLGIAPFLGLRFKINERISLITEMSTMFRIEEVKDQITVLETLVPSPTTEPFDERNDVYNQTRVLYSAPDFLVLSFML